MLGILIMVLDTQETMSKLHPTVPATDYLPLGRPLLTLNVSTETDTT